MISKGGDKKMDSIDLVPEMSRTPKNPSFKKQITEINQPYTAKNIFHQLVNRIQKFEASLDQKHEVGMRLVSFGQSVQFSVIKLSYMDPSLICFEGVLPDGSYVELIQHINQISFLMTAIQRQHPEQEKPKIGFYQESL
jgi:hypothetical protein